MPSVNMLEADLAAVVVIDVQEKILAPITSSPPDVLVDKIRRLVGAARVLDVPILYTEQYPKGLGPTDVRVQALFPEDRRPLVKSACSCWRDAGFREVLQRTRREHVILTGLETHVCVQQTALDLIRVDYVPFVAADAVGSRTPEDREAAFDRMRQAGAAISTTESLIFELVERCDHPKFKAVLEFIK